MTKTFQKSAFALPVKASEISALWLAEGFSFGVFRDPPNQEWNDFVHDTDEYVLVAEGRLTIDVDNESADCGPADLVRIPRGAVHSLKTTSQAGSVWFYGYGRWRGA